MNNITKFSSELFHYWLGKLGLDFTIDMVEDKRLACAMQVEYFSNNTMRLAINPNFIKENYNMSMLISGILHELGHIISNGKYETDEEKIYEELKAELFAILMIRNYYPKHYDAVCKYNNSKLNNIDWQQSAPIHYQAYKNIKEYSNEWCKRKKRKAKKAN